MKELLVASGNRHKLAEIRELLAGHAVHVLGPDDVGGIPVVVEDAATFVGNAMKKATEIARATGKNVIADDSGLEVMVLGGEPGVLSARYAGEAGDDTANTRKLLGRLQGGEDRRARFVCVLAVVGPDCAYGTAEGEVRGRIIDVPRGSNGFGYDPVFVPDGYDETFAELSSSVKNSISHRGQALRNALASGLFDEIPHFGVK